MLNLKSRWVRLSAGFTVATVILWASGIVPQAYNLIQANGVSSARGTTLNFANTASVTWLCPTSGVVTTCSATASGSGGSGGGITVYSGPSVTLLGTQYFPVGGGASSSSTETNVDVESPSAATVGNFYVQLASPLGLGGTTVFTWRKNAAPTTLTCTITGAVATSCNDITHTFTTVQGDLIDIQAVTTGTPAANTAVMATQFGTSGGGGGSFSVNGFYLNDGTNNYVGITNQIATLPLAGNYSWVNQGSATETAVQHALVVHAPAANTGTNLNVRISAISSTTSLVAALICSYATGPQSTGCLFGFYESGTGKLEAFDITQGFIQVNRFSSTSSFSQNQFNAAQPGSATQILWMKLTISGGVISYAYGYDGVNFPFTYSEASNAFFTTAPDNWFYGVNVQGATNDAFNTLLSWKAQ